MMYVRNEAECVIVTEINLITEFEAVWGVIANK